MPISIITQIQEGRTFTAAGTPFDMPVITFPVTYPAGSLLLVRRIAQFTGQAGDLTSTFTISGLGLTWIPIVSACAPNSESVNVQLWYALVGVSDVIGVITVNDSAGFQRRNDWCSVINITGQDPVQPIGTSQGFVDSTTGNGAWSVNLTTAPLASSLVLNMLALDLRLLMADGFGTSPGSGWTAIYGATGKQFNPFIAKRTGSASTTVDWTNTNGDPGGTHPAYQRCEVVVEIRALPVFNPSAPQDNQNLAWSGIRRPARPVQFLRNVAQFITTPSYSRIFPGVAAKISHARILKAHRSPDQAGQFHNSLAGEV